MINRRESSVYQKMRDDIWIKGNSLWGWGMMYWRKGNNRCGMEYGRMGNYEWMLGSGEWMMENGRMGICVWKDMKWCI